MEDLAEDLQASKDAVRAAKARENSLRDELEDVNKDLLRSQKSQKKLQNEKDALEDELNELKKKVQRLSSVLQVSRVIHSRPLASYTVKVTVFMSGSWMTLLMEQTKTRTVREAILQCLVEQSSSFTTVNMSRRYCAASVLSEFTALGKKRMEA